MTRINPTHKADISRTSSPSGSYRDDPVVDEIVVAENEYVRYWARGSFERLPSGERVRYAPHITGSPNLSKVVKKGDSVDLTPINDGFNSYSDLEVSAVREVYSVGSRPVKTRLELGDF